MCLTARARPAAARSSNTGSRRIPLRPLRECRRRRDSGGQGECDEFAMAARARTRRSESRAIPTIRAAFPAVRAEARRGRRGVRGGHRFRKRHRGFDSRARRFCNLVGFKPTYGRVSRYGLIAFASSLDQIGPLARTVEDAALAYDAMGGYDPMDATSIDRPLERPPGRCATIERLARRHRPRVRNAGTRSRPRRALSYRVRPARTPRRGAG